MNTLIILMLIQMAGVIISISISSCIYARNKKKTFISENLLKVGNRHSDNWPWLVDYFQMHPNSTLKSNFPQLYKTAMATKRYKELNRLKSKGKLSKSKYEKRLKKILSLVDIKTELDVSEYKNW